MPTDLAPARVVRFYGNREYALDLLRQSRVSLVHVRCLNDPFDPYCFFETDFGESLTSLLYHVRLNHASDYAWFQANLADGKWLSLVDQVRTLMTRTRNTTFVLSTCAEMQETRPEQNLYMWGHYANGHRGIAVEFSAEKLAKDLIAHNRSVGGPDIAADDIWAKMEYADSLPPLTAEQIFEFAKQELEIALARKTERSITAVEQYYRLNMRIKGRVWSQENEWRLMWRNDEIASDVYQLPISASSINKIFLGMSLADDARDEVIKTAREKFPGAAILQTRRKNGEFALRFERP
jgi:hypothetical protein